MMTITKDAIQFSSGRIMQTNNGIVGINADLDVYEGYDGGVYVTDENWANGSHELTDSEAMELANHMLVLWGRFLWQHQVNAHPGP